MRLRIRALLLVSSAFIVCIGLGTLSLAYPSATPPMTSGMKLTQAQSFKTPSETIGGCRESQLDDGHDADPPGFADQEDDECVPGQHILRNRDGSPASSQRRAG